MGPSSRNIQELRWRYLYLILPGGLFYATNGVASKCVLGLCILHFDEPRRAFL